jgi:hypothetical protein
MAGGRAAAVRVRLTEMVLGVAPGAVTEMAVL